MPSRTGPTHDNPSVLVPDAHFEHAVVGDASRERARSVLALRDMQHTTEARKARQAHERNEPPEGD